MKVNTLLLLLFKQCSTCFPLWRPTKMNAVRQGSWDSNFFFYFLKFGNLSSISGQTFMGMNK